MENVEKRPLDLVILDCGVSDEFMKAVKRVFDVLRPVLDISTDNAIESVQPLLPSRIWWRTPSGSVFSG